MQVNSSHHQAVQDPGRGVVNAVAPDGVIEGLEDPTQRFCIGVQWHPEVHDGQALFTAFVDAAALRLADQVQRDGRHDPFGDLDGLGVAAFAQSRA